MSASARASAEIDLGGRHGRGRGRRLALPTILATAAQRALAQRGALVVGAGYYVIVVVVLAGLWRAGAEANGGAVAGYTATALTWYVLASEAATISLNYRLIEDTGREIASGAVAVELLRPVSVLAVRVATEMGRVLPRLFAFIGIGVVLAALVVGSPPNAVAAALAVPSLVLAVACNVVAQHAFAAAAFWLRDAGSAWFLYQKLVFVVGGMLLPIEVLPSWLESAARVLPFSAMAYAPARLASGHVEPFLLVSQLFWLGVLLVAAAAIFGAGERRLQVVGG